ncbi:accessory Sec system S-layer assembly protein [Brevibacillus fulvus]|uniref:Accessory Sec system S-layer assembly protein n=1 Tax=Brevibacillus fulvus TaxID=1125967 RepID=A0A938Y4N2_9BACL|nr:accessory Sec system S-layer assembly protein [Brevibacillus fulvus]MBM7591522.1 accessory Sec system S-layer assembly protein [Brevibacillus fulvus]
MLSYLKHLLGKSPSPDELKEQVKEESVLPANKAPELIDGKKAGESKASAENETRQSTPLSLHQTWEERLDAKAKYALSFIASDLPPIAEGNISLAGLNLSPHEDGVEVTAFVRNGLPHPIRLAKMNLVILIKDNELFARQNFDLSELGEIPAFHARPWTFVFQRENFLQVNVALLNWKVAFELAQKKLVLPQQLELEESWIQALSDEQKNGLIKLAQKLPPLQQGEVNVQSVQLRRHEDGSLHVLLLFRNGSDRSLSFEKLPLILYDAEGNEAARGLFELNRFVVNAGTSKPWLFIYPPESIVNEAADFSRWKVAVPQG